MHATNAPLIPTLYLQLNPTPPTTGKAGPALELSTHNPKANGFEVGFWTGFREYTRNTCVGAFGVESDTRHNITVHCESHDRDKACSDIWLVSRAWIGIPGIRRISVCDKLLLTRHEC